MPTPCLPRARAAVSFILCDQDYDGRISREELTNMLMATVLERDLALTKEEVREMVSRTLEEAKPKEPGFVDFEEYTALVGRNPAIVKDLTLNVHARIAEELRKRGGGGAAPASGAGEAKASS